MAETLATASFNGRSMVAPLRRVLVCSPRTAGWNRADKAACWKDLGFRHAPDFETAQTQHDVLCGQLRASGAEVIELPPAEQLSLDAVYTHDSSLTVDTGMIALRSGKANRIAEGRHHSASCLNLGIPTAGEVFPPGTTEAGDMVFLDSKTLLIGHGHRTNLAGIQQMRELLAPHGVEVLKAPLPYGAGPSECLHLMSLISLLDEHTALVDLPWLAVETVELLKYRGFKFIEIDSAERETLACNVLALGKNRLLAIEENHRTNARLRQAGYDVRTFAGSELCINGGGGPTCLTRPLLRA